MATKKTTKKTTATTTPKKATTATAQAKTTETVKTATHSTNYVNTFIAVASDCRAPCGTEPDSEKKTIARLQYEMIAPRPYFFTSDDVIFGVFADRQGIAPADRPAARTAFFAKGQPCLRASPLTKTWGWGVHADAEGKVALFGRESAAYVSFVGGVAGDGSAVAVTRAMRNG